MATSTKKRPRPPQARRERRSASMRASRGLEKHPQPAQDRIPDARRSGPPRAAVARALGQGSAVRKAAGGARSRERRALRAARRPALPDRRHPLRHAAQQGPEGHHRPLALADGQSGALRAGLGLPRAAHRAAGREAVRRQGQAGHARLPAEVRGARAQVRRRDARRLPATRLLRHLGRALPDAQPRVRSHHRARAGRLRAPGPALPRQAAGALVHHAPDRAGRGRGRVRRARLAVDLRALPGGARPGPRSRPSSARPRPRWSSGPPRPWTLAANLAVVANPELVYVADPGRADRPRSRAAHRRARAGGQRSSRLAASPPARRPTWVEIAGDKLRSLRGLRYQHPFVATPKSDKDFRLRFASPRHPRRRHRPRAHRARPRRRRLRRRPRRRASTCTRRSTTSAATPPRCRTGRGCPSSRQIPRIVAHLAETGYLLNRPGEEIKHQYPHCWRCKHPVLFRATSQWFARLGDLGRRDKPAPAGAGRDRPHAAGSRPGAETASAA